MQQNCFKISFYLKKLELLEITQKRNYKNHYQNWRNIYIKYLQIIFALPASASFLQIFIDSVEQQLKFSHFEGSITRDNK